MFVQGFWVQSLDAGLRARFLKEALPLETRREFPRDPSVVLVGVSWHAVSDGEQCLLSALLLQCASNKVAHGFDSDSDVHLQHVPRQARAQHELRTTLPRGQPVTYMICSCSIYFEQQYEGAIVASEINTHAKACVHPSSYIH